MPEAGIEPARTYVQRILSPWRLPFRHSGSREAIIPVIAQCPKPDPETWAFSPVIYYDAKYADAHSGKGMIPDRCPMPVAEADPGDRFGWPAPGPTLTPILILTLPPTLIRTQRAPTILFVAF